MRPKDLVSVIGLPESWSDNPKLKNTLGIIGEIKSHPYHVERFGWCVVVKLPSFKNGIGWPTEYLKLIYEAN